MKKHETMKETGDLLRQWTIEEPLPPGFRDRVWRKIAMLETELPQANLGKLLMLRLEAVLRQPVWAGSVVSGILAVGLIAGWSHGQQEQERLQGSLALRYVQTIDPYYTANLSNGDGAGGHRHP